MIPVIIIYDMLLSWAAIRVQAYSSAVIRRGIRDISLLLSILIVTRPLFAISA